VEPGADDAFALILPEVSANAMQVYLDKFAETIGPDEHVLLVLDQAGWHEAKTLRIPANITLEPLPPRSPELNPVERVWLFLSFSRTGCSTTTRPSSTPPQSPGTGWRASQDASHPYAHTLGS
jgi:hypothetical protein